MGRKRKLNEDQVFEIRSNQDSLKALAERYGTTIQTICSVRNFRGAYAGSGKGSPVQADSREGDSVSVDADRVNENEAPVRVESNEKLLEELFK